MGGWQWPSACELKGWEKGSNPATPSSFTPISLALSPHLVTLIQGLERAATGLPQPGCPHGPVFCSWKRSEKRSEKNQEGQRGWALLPSPPLVMPNLVVGAVSGCGDVTHTEMNPFGSGERCSATGEDGEDEPMSLFFFSLHH